MESGDENTAITRRLSAVAVVLASAYLLLSTTSGFRWIESWHDEQRASQIVLLAIVAVIAALLVLRGAPLPRLATSVAVALALGVVSALASGHALDALAEVSLTALLCALALVVATLVRTSRIDTVATWTGRVALFIAAAHVVGAFTRYAAALVEGNALGTEIWMLGFSNPRVASAFYALLIPFSALALSPPNEPHRGLRWIGWVVLTGLWAVAAGLQARALWFSYAVAIPALLVVSPLRHVRRLAIVLIITAAVGAAIQWALPLPGSGSGTAASQSRDLASLASLTARDILWRLAVEAMLGAPLLGIGPGEFARLGSFAGAHPHNWILQVACEWGLPTLVIVLLGLAGLVNRIRSAREPATRNSQLLFAGTLAMFVGLTSALVDGTLVMPTSQVAFSVVFGLTIGSLSSSVSVPVLSTKSNRVVSTLGVAVLISATALVTLQTIATYTEQPRERAAFRQSFPGEWLTPRFWESGLRLIHASSSSRD